MCSGMNRKMYVSPAMYFLNKQGWISLKMCLPGSSSERLVSRILRKSSWSLDRSSQSLTFPIYRLVGCVCVSWTRVTLSRERSLSNVGQLGANSSGLTCQPFRCLYAENEIVDSNAVFPLTHILNISPKMSIGGRLLRALSREVSIAAFS